jgi:hypothetical protein
LGEIHIVPEELLNGGQVGSKPIRRQLHPAVAIQLLSKPVNEPMRGRRVSLAHSKERDQFALGVQGHEHILVANLGIGLFLVRKPLLLAPV